MKPKFIRTVQPDELAKRRKRKPTLISLFSGCGGFDLGTTAAGFETRVMVEWDEAACDTLRGNWTRAGAAKWKQREIDAALKRGDKRTAAALRRWMKSKRMGSWYHEREPAIMQVDITKTPTAEILAAGGLECGEADMLTGGFPCQGFSMAGPRKVDDSRNVLYKECVRVIRESKPKSFILENVKGLISMAGGRIIRKICDDLADSGYDLRWALLNAADYGVPQHRERVFFIGKRRDILVDRGPNGRPALYMGHGRGEIVHHEGFEKKYPL